MPGKNTTWTEANKSDYNALYNLLVNKKVKNIEAHKFDYIKFLQQSPYQTNLEQQGVAAGDPKE